MNIFIYLAQVTLCLAFFYAFYLIALSRETTFQSNRLYLLFSILISILLPLIKIYIDQPQETLFVAGPTYAIGAYMTTFEETVIAASAYQGPDWLKLFIGLYIAGIILFSARMLRELINLWLIKKAGAQTHMNGCTCIVSEKIKTPFSFFNLIYLPEKHGFSDEEIREVISHESAHIRGKHTLDILFLEMAAIGLWISPMIYLYRRKLRELHEFIADAEVLKDSNWEKYAAFLLSQKSYGLQNKLSNQLIYSQLKNRIVMFTRKPSSPLRRMKYLGLIPLLLLVIVIFSFREREVIRSGQGDQHYNQSKYNIYEDGIKVYTELGNWIYPGRTNQNSSIDTLPDVYINASGLPNAESKNEENQDASGASREVFTYVEQMPTFVNCSHLPESERMKCNTEAIYSFINKSIIYPAEARKNGIEGRVIVHFIVEADGSMSDIKIIKGVSAEIDAEAMRVMNAMKERPQKWVPGYKADKPVAVSFTLPIRFALHQKENIVDTLPANEVYTHVEQMPRFPGCEHLPENERWDCSIKAMNNFIYEALKYPIEEREKGVQGTVIVQFIIKADGSISNAKIVRGVSPGLDAEGLRVIHLMNEMPEKWIPGMKDGKAVDVQFTMPFKFVLQVDDKPSSSRMSDLWGEKELNDVNQPVSNDWINVYPNPASNFVILKSLEPSTDIRITDITKRSLKWERKDVELGSEFQIDISTWPSGKYVIYVMKDNELKMGGFIVQH